jgi:EmrB/QacA subfamily drug resistance transporter
MSTTAPTGTAPTNTAPPNPAGPEPPARPWAAIVVIAVAQLMIALDATVVNIALPSAQQALGFDDQDRQWVITAYTLTFAGLLLLGGRVADLVGRRTAFLGGLVGFALASALAGAAQSFAVLTAGRALQGACAAVLAPTALSMVAVTFTDPKQRAKAFGVYGAVASSGGVAGLILGGALTEYAAWRWCLYVNVFIAAGAFIAGRVFLPATPATPATHRTRFDVLSGLLATAGLAAIVFACTQAVEHGWTSTQVAVPGAFGVLSLTLFLVRQGRVESPLLPLHVIRHRARAGAYLATAAAVVGSFGLFLVLTYHLQVVKHYTPLQAGLAFLPLAVAVSVSAYGIASRLMARVSPVTLIVPGLLVGAVGLGLMSRLEPSSDYLTLIMPAQVLLGLGMGCVFTPSISLATSDIEPRLAGVAAAVANTAMQVGGSIGTAVLNTIAVTATTAYVSQHVGAGSSGALVHGYAVATGWAAGLLVLVAVLSGLLISTSRTTPRTPAEPRTPTASDQRKDRRHDRHAQPHDRALRGPGRDRRVLCRPARCRDTDGVRTVPGAGARERGLAGLPPDRSGRASAALRVPGLRS